LSCVGRLLSEKMAKIIVYDKARVNGGNNHDYFLLLVLLLLLLSLSYF